MKVQAVPQKTNHQPPAPWLRIEPRLGRRPWLREYRKVQFLRPLRVQTDRGAAADSPSPPRTEASQPQVPEWSVEQPGDAILGRSPSPIYHDPHPPFETDGRGRVVWSNSSEQARLRSLSSPPVQSRKPEEEEGVTGEKDNHGAIGPGIRTGDSGDTDANVDSNVGGCGREAVVEGGANGVP